MYVDAKLLRAVNGPHAAWMSRHGRFVWLRRAAQVLYVGTPVLLWYSNEVVDQQAQEAFQKAANGCPVTAVST